METTEITLAEKLILKATELADLIKQHCMNSLQIASTNTQVNITKYDYDVDIMFECSKILEVSLHKPSWVLNINRCWFMYSCGNISVTVYSKLTQ